MAQKKNPSKPGFFEVVFQGKPKMVRAFMSGLLMGTGEDATIFYSYTEGVHHEGKAEKLAEMTHLRAIDCHVIVDRNTSSVLKSLARKIKNETGLEITSHRSIRSASLEFEFEAFAPRYNMEIMKVLDKLPDGLKLSGFKHDVKVDPKARGVEAYSTAHHYEARGKGSVVGRVDLVIAMKHRMAEFPLIKSKDVRLKLA